MARIVGGHNSELREFRVAVVTYPFHDEVGRATLSNFIEVVERVSKEVYVITGALPVWPNSNVHVIRLNTDVHKGPLIVRVMKAELVDLTTAFHLIRIRRRVDVVIFHIGTAVHIWSLLAARLSGKETSQCVTGLFSTGARQRYNRAIQIAGRFLEVTRLSILDQVAVQSPACVGGMGLERYKDKIAINGAVHIDTDLFRPTRDFDKRENVVGYVGRLIGGKGIMEFLDAVPIILKSRDDVSFLIGGGGPLQDRIVDSLERNHLGNKVRLAGLIPHDEVPNHLNSLKLLVLPSVGEGLPGIVQEAMACGTVVLATPVGGVPDLIMDGETGFILEKSTPECIADGVLRALSHPNLGRIGENARRLIEREYSRDAMVEKCRIVLDELMARRK